MATKADVAFKKKQYAKAADGYFSALECSTTDAERLNAKMERAARLLAKQSISHRQQAPLLAAPRARASYNAALAVFTQRKDSLLAWEIARYNVESHPCCPAATHTFASLSTDPNIWPSQLDRLPCFRHSQAVCALSFSANGNSLLSVAMDSTARVWELNGDEVWRYTHPSSKLVSGALAPDERYVLVGSRDGVLLLIPFKLPPEEMKRAEQLLVEKGGGAKILVSSHYGEFIQQLPPAMTFNAHRNSITSISFSPDSRNFLTASRDGTVKMLNLQGADNQLVKKDSAIVWSAVYAPFVASQGRQVLTANSDHTACLWNPDGSLSVQFSGHRAAVTSAVFSPDGRYVFTTSGDSTARLWDLDGRLLKVFLGHDDVVWCGAFAPDGRHVLTGSWDKTARLWELESGKLLETFCGHDKAIYALAFSPDGKKIATGSADGSVRVWTVGRDCLECQRGKRSIAELQAAGVQVEDHLRR